MPDDAALVMKPPMQIGPWQLPARAVLAPMAGVTDRPFRILARKLGAGLAASEMITSDTGEFSFRGIPAASYMLKISAEGFETLSLTLDLKHPQAAGVLHALVRTAGSRKCGPCAPMSQAEIITRPATLGA